MRILYITDALAVWGGIERVLSDKTDYLVNHGYEVHIVTMDQGNHPIPFPLNERVHVKDLDIRFHRQYKYHGIMRLIKYFEYEILFRKRLKSYIDNLQPDIISCIRDGNVSNVLRVRGDIPVVFESHALCKDIEFEKVSFLHKISSIIGRNHFRKLDMIITLTNGDAHDWKRYCKKVCVIPNMVHLNTTGAYSDCSSKRIIFAGRFDVQKNVGALIEIWKIVQKRYPDWELDIYGNGELKSRFENDVVDKKLNIIINPAVPNIFDKYKESSVLIMTSMYEPFGLVLVEAMSCGLPVIAFDCPYGPADIITDGVDGFIIENGNTDAFADAVCTLIKNPELRKKMGKSGIVSSNRYKAETIMPQWIQLFTNLKRDM